MGQRKGQTGNPHGRPKGLQNKATLEFKEAVKNLIEFATPEMVDWLKAIAKEDPSKALEHVYKFAQFGHPLLARSELVGEGGKDLFPKSIQIEAVVPKKIE